MPPSVALPGRRRVPQRSRRRLATTEDRRGERAAIRRSYRLIFAVNERDLGASIAFPWKRTVILSVVVVLSLRLGTRIS